VVLGLVLAVMAPLVMLVAVTVWEPAVFEVTGKVLVPATRAALAGNIALVCEDVIPTVLVALTTFQLASTALTVTLKDVPAVRAVAEPVFPELVPGAAVSPGIRS